MSDATYLRLRAAALLALVVGVVALAAGGEDAPSAAPPARQVAPVPGASQEYYERFESDRPLVLQPATPRASETRCLVPAP